MIARTPYTRTVASALAISVGLWAAPVQAQDSEPQEIDQAAPADAAPQASGRGTTYPPAYFERYGPRNALEMLNRVPGFQISGGGGGGGNNGRGLGQADENVIVNGQRLSSKSDSVQDQLQRIPAKDVLRIEIVDGTALDIPGLSGQVANVVVDLSGVAGTFNWEGGFRTTAVDPEWYGGEISVAGTTGALNYTLALSNNNNRFGAEGPTLIVDGDGNLLQAEDTVFTGGIDRPTATANLGYDFGSDVTATLNLSYTRSYFDRFEDEAISGPALDPFLRAIRTAEDGYEYEIGGDVTFPIGAGRLKLIGLESYDDEDFGQTVTSLFDDTTIIPTGSRFTRADGSGERIARAEYNFPLWEADWQISGEAAFNRLNRVSGLFELAPDGSFTELDFPEGTGGVRESRYEIAASFSRALTDRLSLQATGGYEFSTIKQTGSAANQRSFSRPKGEVSLSWQVAQGFDVTAAIERRVGQLSFGDFLARVFLDDGNANAGNNELVPSQTWEARIEVNKTLGEWGSTTFFYEQRWIEDFVDLIPLPGGGEARGNIDKARRTEMEWTTTLLMDPIGWTGAQFDIRLEYEEGEVVDPLTGELRDFSNGRDRELEIDFRHDVPGTDFAYGGGVQYNRDRPYFRLREIGREQDGPTFANVFVEHKDLLGLTVRATAANLFGGRDRFVRTVYDGPRDEGRIAFIEDRSRRIGPIFRFSVSGNF
ncbi:TonB-dependent receptor [Erythrobacter sp. HKB08]|uniref:TonB-dependent receptor plug domain-containing protein n=1 Tax=Erythrobacter sp. HKB08 TaxID=2502843 RepID=UPI0010092398|nr:TonB-dependent receptor [Erythrobacter sp. HKB08]